MLEQRKAALDDVKMYEEHLAADFDVTVGSAQKAEKPKSIPADLKRYRRSKIKNAILDALRNKPDSLDREVCDYLDEEENVACPYKKPDGKRFRSWVEAYDGKDVLDKLNRKKIRDTISKSIDKVRRDLRQRSQ